MIKKEKEKENVKKKGNEREKLMGEYEKMEGKGRQKLKMAD